MNPGRQAGLKPEVELSGRLCPEAGPTGGLPIDVREARRAV